MGEASSVKVSDREKFASCNLGDTFKVWSLVYTRRYSLQQDESIGLAWEVLWEQEGLELPRELGLCEGQLSPSWALLIGKGHLGPSLCPHLSQGSLSLVGSWASGEPRERGWAEPNWAQGGIQNPNVQNKQTNKQKILLLLCNKNPLVCVSPAQLPVGSACIWGRSLCSHEQPSDLQH